jgi:Acyl-CoA carboxylase epsilon subunit
VSPLIEVTRGQPGPVELAALVSVVLAMAADAPPQAGRPGPERATWMVPHFTGPASWRRPLAGWRA